jgi:predicted TIM-barrel fold metal-dependent hydrolase
MSECRKSIVKSAAGISSSLAPPRFHYDTMTYDLETLRFLVELVGSDRVVVGTDNSFGPRLNFEWPNAIVESLNLPAADQDRILRGNAKRLFRI